mmetsp:Transcript_13/g.80  ORF Transcript_13/g.80 Transcript_13/m.80 type:complete len:237 (-) Transcript_13:47-757(-)
MTTPPLPMTPPTQCAGHITVMLTSALSSRTILSTISSALSTASGSPTTITRLGPSSSSCPSASCSHTTLAPVSCVIRCRPRPSLPRSLTTTLRGTSLALLMSRLMCATLVNALRSVLNPMLPVKNESSLRSATALCSAVSSRPKPVAPVAAPAVVNDAATPSVDFIASAKEGSDELFPRGASAMSRSGGSPSSSPFGCVPSFSFADRPSSSPAPGLGATAASRPSSASLSDSLLSL